MYICAAEPVIIIMIVTVDLCLTAVSVFSLGLSVIVLGLTRTLEFVSHLKN